MWAVLRAGEVEVAGVRGRSFPVHQAGETGNMAVVAGGGLGAEREYGSSGGDGQAFDDIRKILPFLVAHLRTI